MANRGGAIPTVMANPVGEGTAAALETRTDQDTEAVLRADRELNAIDLSRPVTPPYPLPAIR